MLSRDRFVKVVSLWSNLDREGVSLSSSSPLCHFLLTFSSPLNSPLPTAPHNMQPLLPAFAFVVIAAAAIVQACLRRTRQLIGIGKCVVLDTHPLGNSLLIFAPSVGVRCALRGRSRYVCACARVMRTR